MNPRHLFIDTVTLQSRTGSSPAGDPAWDTQRVILGRVETKERRAVGPQGVVVSTATVLVTDVEVKTGDRIWLPGADTTVDAQARRLGTVTSARTASGNFKMFQADLG